MKNKNKNKEQEGEEKEEEKDEKEKQRKTKEVREEGRRLGQEETRQDKTRRQEDTYLFPTKLTPTQCNTISIYMYTYTSSL
ncbi:hypothetical protein E2C01_034869 [Portunus trituberculatus]|uniref:Uncharacterized protein n=1 Tax=Portunus trituberculatus TaxID=210409 RepID=A0A5B7F2N7_PORTR|nr:hypothetical protein [Portunus trituberculatus]